MFVYYLAHTQQHSYAKRRYLLSCVYQIFVKAECSVSYGRLVGLFFCVLISLLYQSTDVKLRIVKRNIEEI